MWLVALLMIHVVASNALPFLNQETNDDIETDTKDGGLINLNEDLSFGWQVDNSENIQLQIHMSVESSWLIFGFQNIPFEASLSERLMYISVDIKRLVIRLKTVEPARKGFSILEKIESIYEWKSKQLDHANNIFKFNISRKLINLPIATPIALVYANGIDDEIEEFDGIIYPSIPMEYAIFNLMEKISIKFLSGPPTVADIPTLPPRPTTKAVTKAVESTPDNDVSKESNQEKSTTDNAVSEESNQEKPTVDKAVTIESNQEKPSVDKAVAKESNQEKTTVDKAVTIESNQEKPSVDKAVIIESNQEKPSVDKAVTIESNQDLVTPTVVNSVVNTPCPTIKCNCSSQPKNDGHWYDVVNAKDNSVYFSIIGASALLTGLVVLCVACCCARSSAVTKRSRAHKVAFYKVDDLDSESDEEVEFLKDDK